MRDRWLPQSNPLNKKVLICIIALCAWSFFLWRGITVFKPGVASLTYFHSDAAVPVLMIREQRPLTPFNLYYYGSDRWGGWPFLIGQAVSRITGFRWSDVSLAIFQIVWIFVGGLIIAALTRKDYAVAGAVFLLTICLHGETRYQIFWLSEVYGWQMTVLLAGWFCLRKLVNSWCEPGTRTRRWIAWAAAAFLFSYLAIWSSGTSLLFLPFIAAIEIARVRVQPDAPRIGLRQWLRIGGTAFGAIAGAAVLERVQRSIFYSYSLKHYGSDFSASSHFQLDVGNLSQNLAAQIGKLIMLRWWPLELIGVLALLIAVSLVIYALVKKPKSLSSSWQSLLNDDTLWLIIGGAGIALINFVITVLIAHVRINQYEDRYLTPTVILGPVSGFLAVYLILKTVTRRSRIAPMIMPIAAAAVVLWTIVRFPTPGNRHEYRTFHEIAAALEQKAPRSILLGDYWGTYVFAALQHSQPVTPVPVEGQLNRMPWTREMARQATEVIVEYRRSKLAESGPPPERLVQYGSTFRLVDPKFYEQSVFAFARYVRDNSAP